ncbi:hypothetical protein HAX54_036430 [Datura stramonium]|uniref:Uncharacterized protein n=1 Tax=Datura stramonium TaxID=4076 RepID=A0ABS8SGF6_DATST|nr:hypothetical protein [Datura stramonium]
MHTFHFRSYETTIEDVLMMYVLRSGVEDATQHGAPPPLHQVDYMKEVAEGADSGVEPWHVLPVYRD